MANDPAILPDNQPDTPPAPVDPWSNLLGLVQGAIPPADPAPWDRIGGPSTSRTLTPPPDTSGDSSGESDPGHDTGGNTNYVAHDAGQSVSNTAGYPDAARMAAEQLVLQFMAAIDWPTSGVDANALQLLVLQKGFANDSNQAFATMFGTLSATLQKQFRGAEFGMQPDAYNAVSGSLGRAFSDATGGQIPQDALRQAIVNGWTASELQNYLFELASGSVGGGKSGSDSGAPTWFDVNSSPWLASGVSYLSAAQAFAQADPTGGKSPASVASWWKFVAGARNLAPSSQQPTQLSQHELRPMQSETR